MECAHSPPCPTADEFIRRLAPGVCDTGSSRYVDLAYYLRADEAQAACKGGEVVFSTDHVIEEKSALETRGKRFLCLNLVSLQRH